MSVFPYIFNQSVFKVKHLTFPTKCCYYSFNFLALCPKKNNIGKLLFDSTTPGAVSKREHPISLPFGSSGGKIQKAIRNILQEMSKFFPED